MIYKALLSQTGLNAPVAELNISELGGNVSFQYDSVGEYSILSNGLFKENKTHAYLGLNYRALTGDVASYQLLWVNESCIKLLTFDDAGVFDEALTNTPIAIEVF